MTFTPGSDDDRTDTYEAQIKLQEDDVSTEQEFKDAQQGLQDANTWFQRTLGIYGALTDKVAPTVTSTINSIFEFNNEDTKIGLDKYSSGKVVQTEQGPLYRADGISSVFQMVNDPEPIQRKTPGAVERELLTNRFVNELYTYVDVTNRKGEVIRKHISKIQPNAYKELGKAKAEWNQWAKRTGYIRLLSDKTMTAYVEHLVGKDKFYDWFWTLPNEQRFRKGSRHGPNNVRILKDNRMKTFKDTAEGILKRLYPNPTVKTGLLFDYEFGPRKGKSIMIDQSPGDLLLKRANGTVVGKLGDYHDVLYAPYQQLVKGLSENINKETGRPFIATKLPDGTPYRDEDIRAQVSLWRSTIIGKKIELIVEEAPKLAGKTKKERNRLMDEAIVKDMVDVLDKHPFLKPGKRLRALLNQEDFKKLYDNITTEDEKLNPEFLTKKQVRQRKLKNIHAKSLLRSLFGKERIDRDYE